MTSRSRFYVDTPRDPSQRHSMFVSHSELAREGGPDSNASSATLPTAAGSVDRLTGLEEKKSPRFFTLKPKTSFSLRPFFKSSSSSLISLSSPGKRRKIALERRDSDTQTEQETRPEVGVQTLNASTVDVPVQTCSETWEEGDSYGQKRLAYTPARASPFCSRPYGISSGHTNSLTAKNVPKDPLASPKFLKYAALSDLPKTASVSHQSAVSPLSVNSCQPVSPPPHASTPDSTNVPVKYFSTKELTGNAISLAVSPQNQTVKEFSPPPASTKIYDNFCLPSTKPATDGQGSANNLCLPFVNPVTSAKVSEKEVGLPSLAASTDVKDCDKDLCKSETPLPVEKTSSDTTQEVSDVSKYSLSQSADSPLSALKIERTDSPSRRLKTVHFDLPGSELPKNSPISCKPRNVDKDFEALLRDLNIWTGDDENELKIKFDNVPPPNQCPTPTLLSPNLKSAVDILKQDFLAPIPETANETNDSEENNEIEKPVGVDVNTDKNIVTCDSVISKKSAVANENKGEANNINKVSDVSYKSVNSKVPLTRSISEYENLVTAEVNKKDSATPTSEAIITSANSGSNAETASLEGNVYDSLIKEENPVKTVPLPTLPSFFEPPPQPRFFEITEIFESVDENSFECPPDTEKQSEMSSETDFERNRLSRSSSRSSVRSSTKNGFDALHENRFDSCENLDQLEEEIIRSLYSPDEGKLEENIMQNIELPPSESFQNSGTTATHMRRVILDQLLSGKSVSDIVPNYKGYQRAQSVPETTSKYKPAKKYTAILTKMENDGYENSASKFSPGNALNSMNLNSAPNEEILNQRKDTKIADTKYINLTKIDSPKKTTVFLFPENNFLKSSVPENSPVEISTSPQHNQGLSVLEVRRSSWTPQCTVNGASDSPSHVTNIENPSITEDNFSCDKSGHCDFTNCLRPSKIQSSPFLSKINTRSMSPCNFSQLPPVQNSFVVNNSSAKRHESPLKPPEAVGECDYASCLKPSQVHNSLFTAELSEITACKSTNSLRSGSPLTVRMNSPLTLKSSSLDNSSISPIKLENKINHDEESEPASHKSELLITLQTATKHSRDLNNTKLEDPQLEIKEKSDICSSLKLSDPSPDQPIDVILQTKIKESAVAPSPPPPPPPPLPSSQMLTSVATFKENSPCDTSLESMIKDQKFNLTTVEVPVGSRCTTPTPKTPVMVELEKRLQDRRDSQTIDSEDKVEDKCALAFDGPKEISNGGRYESNINGSSNFPNGNQFQNGNIEILSEPREYSSPVSNGKSNGNGLHTAKLTFSPNTIVTDEPPPAGAVLLDKKVTIDGDKVHTDKFYAIPMKEVLKEKTSTTKFIPAPPKYEGIGPTEDGIPIGLRNSVKKENMHNWYKTMFKSLHKADSSNDPQEYIIGYTSEPETSKKDVMVRKKSSTLDSRLKQDVNSNFKQNYPPSAKSSIEIYNVRPRLIEDYEPGHSSVTDDEIVTSRRYLPALNAPKPSYEFKNGYESDTTVTRKKDQPESLTPEQQKMWYREVQKGADIPQFGLGKPTPEKPKEISIGPIPPPPVNYNGPSYQQAVRPLTLPADYSNQNGNGFSQQLNGSYEMQMRHAIHSEMQQRRSPNCNQLSPPIRTMVKSPSRSPDMRIPAQALFDFKAESPKEIPLKKGDTVLVLRQLDKNWYEGEHKGVVGIFPISYVEIVPPEHASTPVKPKPDGLGRALYDFVAQTSVELTVRKGDAITLIRRVDANWFEAIFKSKKGIVPISYIQVLQEPVERDVKSPSLRSYTASPSSESKDKLKVNSISPSAYSSSSTSPLPVTQERRKLANKKGSHLIEPVMYRALYSYSPQNSDELELHEGDSVYVVEMCDDGWFVGTSVRSGVFGIFPGNYVEKTC